MIDAHSLAERHRIRTPNGGGSHGTSRNFIDLHSKQNDIRSSNGCRFTES